MNRARSHFQTAYALSRAGRMRHRSMTLAGLDGLKLLDVSDEDIVGKGNVMRNVRREMR